MGRWPVVAGRKAVQDAQRGKVFAIHSKLISIAARKWGDPSENASLYSTLEKARKDSVPKDVIERAIKRGTWEDKDAAEILEATYEGYGPAGVGIIVKTLTDNKNRTAANMRTAFSKNHGNLGETGSLTSHMFQLLGYIKIVADSDKEDLLFESGCDDYEKCEWGFELTCQKESLQEVRNFLNENEIEMEEDKLIYRAGMDSDVTDFQHALHLIKLLEALWEDEDVQDVFTNGSIDEALQKEVEDYIEEHAFKS